MKILLFLIIVLSASCAQRRYCQPSPGSRDYARHIIKQRPDGYYQVTTSCGFRKETVTVFECEPEPYQLAAICKKNN